MSKPTKKTSWERRQFSHQWRSLWGEANAIIPGGLSSAAFRDAVRDVAERHIGWKRERLLGRHWVYAAEYYIEMLIAQYDPVGKMHDN